MTGEAFLDELRVAQPGLRLLTDPTEVEPYRHDHTAHLRPGQPLGVACPTSTQAVSDILRLATAHRVPVVPRGAGSGLSGGAAAIDGALTVSLAGLDRILHVSADDLYVVVQPGVLNAALGRAIEPQGLFYPPDPASHEYCSIGATSLEDAGGSRCIKYGVTRDYVLGLEVVLADGSVIRTGGRTIKDAMGYDLTQLFRVGLEGTLGIITEATLRSAAARRQRDRAGVLRVVPVDAGRAAWNARAASCPRRSS
ncbi:MAG: FAD-binding protein [Chloroflexota bacterium]